MQLPKLTKDELHALVDCIEDLSQSKETRIAVVIDPVPQSTINLLASQCSDYERRNGRNVYRVGRVEFFTGRIFQDEQKQRNAIAAKHVDRIGYLDSGRSHSDIDC